jgi:chemotaxis protein methyltransferase CheR
MIEAFPRLREFLGRRIGMALDESKHYLVEGRLGPVARRFGAADVDALLGRLGDEAIEQAIIDAMTTPETLFFRDRAPFELFASFVLPRLIERRSSQRQIRIWCAGCATGQEPYSIAMLIDEQARQLAGWRIDIVGTDVSRAALDVARTGAYNQFEVQRGLPVAMLLRYFTRDGDRWRVADHLRARIEFRELNLVTNFGGLGLFDVIFCRNVLYYFDVAAKEDTLARIAGACRPDGFLVLGAAETVLDQSPHWRRHGRHPSLFVRREDMPATTVRPRLVASR